MKSLKTILSCSLLALLAAGCSQVMPNPEVEITKVCPPALTGTKITFTFTNKNNVDAVITKERIFCQGADTLTLNYSINLYVPAKGSSDLITEWDAASLNALRDTIGYNSNNERTMTFYYSGTDAYGYNKTFTVRKFTISF